MLVHLYGVISESATLPPDLRGRRNHPLRLVADNGLRAVVSDVPEGAAVCRADLLSHAHVLEALTRSNTVLPGQFGLLFGDDQDVRRDLLRARKEELTDLLSAFEGLVQFTVHARQREESALREVLRRDRNLRRLRDATRQPDCPADLQLQLGEAVTDALRRLGEEEGRGLIERLAPVARAVAVNESRGVTEVADVALLVERDRQRDLDLVVTQIAEDAAALMTLRYVGPQPPYSFLEPMRQGELAWA